MIVAMANKLLAPFAHALCGYVECCKRLCRSAFAFVYKAKQKVFAANIVMAHVARSLLSKCKRFLRAFVASI